MGSDNPLDLAGRYIESNFSLINWIFEVPGSRSPPEFVPINVSRIFEEGANCLAIGAWDAAGAMFRKVLDVATRDRTPKPDSEEAVRPNNWKTYKDLRLRLDWLFEHGKLDRSLKGLSSCIHQDGNDAAHDVDGIGEDEAEDLIDFAEQVLRVIYTIPGQISENEKRRVRRREK